jgi:hypothetical protein
MPAGIGRQEKASGRRRSRGWRKRVFCRVWRPRRRSVSRVARDMACCQGSGARVGKAFKDKPPLPRKRSNSTIVNGASSHRTTAAPTFSCMSEPSSVATRVLIGITHKVDAKNMICRVSDGLIAGDVRLAEYLRVTVKCLIFLDCDDHRTIRIQDRSSPQSLPHLHRGSPREACASASVRTRSHLHLRPGRGFAVIRVIAERQLNEAASTS